MPSPQAPNDSVIERAANGNIDAILQAISEGASLGLLRGLRKKDMEAIYAIAHNLYTHGRFDQAEKVFQFLCFYGHLEQKHWQGLGGCRQALGKYSQAIEAYAMMALCDVSDPQPAFYAAQCFFHLGRKDDAYKALLAVIDLSGNQSEYQMIRARAQSLLNARKAAKRKSAIETASSHHSAKENPS